jgi:AbrB family looped-hinge helix DNA binding protein
MKVIKQHIRVVTTKGQVTIPAKIRQLLGIKPHDKVVFQVIEGKVELQPVSMSLEATFGAVPSLNCPEDFTALRNTAQEEHVQHVIAEMKG